MQEERNLKWRALDVLESVLMWTSGLLLALFTATVFLDVLTRSFGNPWPLLSEVTTGAFIWGVFLGGSVAVRRNQHFHLSAIASSMTGRKRLVVEVFNRLVVLGISFSLIYHGYLNFLQGFGSFLQTSGQPIAVLTAAIPVLGVLTALFTVEQLFNGCRNGFEGMSRDVRERVSEEKGVNVA